jgi:hypothetical protein
VYVVRGVAVLATTLIRGPTMLRPSHDPGARDPDPATGQRMPSAAPMILWVIAGCVSPFASVEFTE